MKTKIFLLISLMLFTGNCLFSQNLKGSVEADGIYGNNFFKPVKAGKSFSLKMKIKNTGNTMKSLYINRDSSFPHHSWVSIPYNDEISIQKDQSAVYSVNVKVPYNTEDLIATNFYCIYLLQSNGQYLSTYLSGNFNFLVDNTPPTNVETEVESYSKHKITVSTRAYDYMSKNYTDANQDSGKDGIAKFTVQLKDLSGTTLATKNQKVKGYWEDIQLKSSSIKGHTTYRIYLTATDLAGNTSDPVLTEYLTPPDPPSNLHATNITYHNFTLNWNAAPGATEYKVYDVTKNTPKLIGTTSTTQLLVEELEMGETRKYAIKTVAPGWVSWYSKKLEVTTLKLEIIGSYSVCNQESYGLKDNILTGYPVHWSTNNGNLQLVSDQGSPNATFQAGGYGYCTIKVKIADIEATKKVHIGTVVNIPFTVNSQSGSEVLCKDIMNELVVDLSTSEALSQTISEYEWKVSDPSWQLLEHPTGSGNPIKGKNFIMLLQGTPYSSSSVYISIRARNTCGWGEWSFGKYFAAENCQRHTSVNYFISPNGDGKNDTWEITSETQQSTPTTAKNTTQYLLTYNVTIFNKKGNIIYRKENYMQDEERFSGVGNTGEYSGKTLPDGDYFFTITGSITESGHIYMKRE